MLESFGSHLLVGALCLGFGYACGTHPTWLPWLGGFFSRLTTRVARPAPTQTTTASTPFVADVPSASAPETKSRPAWVKL